MVGIIPNFIHLDFGLTPKWGEKGILLGIFNNNLYLCGQKQTRYDNRYYRNTVIEGLRNRISLRKFFKVQ